MRTLHFLLTGIVAGVTGMVPLTGCRLHHLSQTDSEAVTVPLYSIEELLDSTTYLGASFSPDQSEILVSASKTGIFNVYAIDATTGVVTAMTASDSESTYSLGYFPSDERFLYTADQGGNELDHIFVRELDGSNRDLTPGGEHKARFLEFASDGSCFYLLTTERDPRFFDLYRYDSDSYDRKLVYREEMGLTVADIGPRGRFLALQKTTSRSDGDVFIYDLELNDLRSLSAEDDTANELALTFGPEGKSLWLASDGGGEFRDLLRYDLASGRSEIILQPGWDVTSASFSRGGRYLVVSINQDSGTVIQLYDATSSELLKPPQPAAADISSLVFSQDESLVAFYAGDGRSPRDLWLTTLGENPRKLTQGVDQRIDPSHMVRGKVVRFKSFDGLEIPGILYRPHSASKDHLVPALVWVHGGPGGQTRVDYSPFFQYLVNHGYAVFAINNRGSSGYGRTFFGLDDRRHGTDDLDDCVASKQMLAASGFVDTQRIGIMGGSYGGFMTLAALTFRPEEFALGINLYGVSNWLRTLQSIPPWWESFRDALEQEMGDFDDEEYLRGISPLFHADNIVRPLMVLQGANDPRVLPAESDEIVAAARKNGVPVEYVVFADEGHGFRKRENQVEAFRRIRQFLDLHLGRI